MSTRRPRRKEVPRDFLKGKIEKFTAKLERAKSAGNDDDIKKYTARKMVSCSLAARRRGACASEIVFMYQQRVD